MKNTRCLVLNADYTPMSVISTKRALILSYKYMENPKIGVNIIDFYADDYIVDSKGRKYSVPAVAVSSIYVKPSKNGPSFSKKNVLIRDGLYCQYCGVKYYPHELTLDHVIPRAKWNNKTQGTPTRWENVVASCKRCNTIKADKTLKESGLKLLREPKKPGKNIFILGLSPWSDIPNEWQDYLPNYYMDIIQTFKK